MNRGKRIFQWIAIIIFVLGFIEMISTIDCQLETSHGGLIGTTMSVVGICISAIGTFYIANTFIEQSRKNRSEVFEKKFYELFRLLRENVDEFHDGELRGREVIERFFYYLKDIYDNVNTAITTIEHTVPPSTNKGDVALYEKMKDYLSKLDEIDMGRERLIHKLSYGYFFYGIQNYHLTNNKEDVVHDINLEVTVILEGKKMKKELITPRNSLLGHYYRHLYQIVQLVAKEDIKEEKKYEYVKMLRAQLSDFEQVLLYYNSLSVMGEKWITPLGKTAVEKMCYIARFRLIKNMPYYIEYFGIHPDNLFKIEKKIWEKKGKNFFEIDLTIP